MDIFKKAVLVYAVVNAIFVVSVCVVLESLLNVDTKQNQTIGGLIEISGGIIDYLKRNNEYGYKQNGS